MAIEIVDLDPLKMVDLSSSLCQRLPEDIKIMAILKGNHGHPSSMEIKMIFLMIFINRESYLLWGFMGDGCGLNPLILSIGAKI